MGTCFSAHADNALEQFPQVVILPADPIPVVESKKATFIITHRENKIVVYGPTFDMSFNLDKTGLSVTHYIVDLLMTSLQSMFNSGTCERFIIMSNFLPNVGNPIYTLNTLVDFRRRVWSLIDILAHNEGFRIVSQ